MNLNKNLSSKLGSGVVVFAYQNIGIIGLKSLLKNNIKIHQVFTHKDNKNHNIWWDSVFEFCKEKSINCDYDENYTHREIYNIIKKLKILTIFSFHYRRILPEYILELPQNGCINLHCSLLPKYRGKAPVNWQIINGEKKSGFTLHYMTKHIDEGNIIYQFEVPISYDDNILSLYRKLENAVEQYLNESIKNIVLGNCSSRKQIISEGSYYGTRKPEDGIIDWSSNAIEIYNLIRAVTKPYPGAFTYLNGKKILIWKAQILSSNHNYEFEGPSNFKLLNGDLLVKTRDDIMIIDEYDLELTSQKKRIDGTSLIKGFFDQV